MAVLSELSMRAVHTARIPQSLCRITISKTCAGLKTVYAAAAKEAGRTAHKKFGAG